MPASLKTDEYLPISTTVASANLAAGTQKYRPTAGHTAKISEKSVLE
jgi:hypothetical protein